MPTIIVAGKFRIRILNPPREHGPAHVHVVAGRGVGAGEVVIDLGEPLFANQFPLPVGIREVRGMQDRDVVTAVRLVEAHRTELYARWRALHGDIEDGQ